MKRFITVFPECGKIHLKKDVGMLPYSVGQYTKYDFGIVVYENDEFTADEISKYNIIQVSKKKDDTTDFFNYILHNGKNIDILNLYHITSRRNLWWIIAYKIVNPRGIVYIKLDADYRMVDMVDMHPKTVRGKLKKYILTKKVDLYTVESNKMYNLLKKAWGINLRVLPNGIFRENDISPSTNAMKENMFLTVCRLGTEQKATDDLMEAFKLIKDKTDWSLLLVGDIEEEFKKFIEEFYTENPDLRERVLFVGAINDDKALTDIYIKAKVFVLPSKWESFGLVLLEALECGDYLVVSDQVPSSDDIGKNGQFATVVRYHDITALSEAMFESTKIIVTDDEMCDMNKWVHSKFSWKIIANKLECYLDEMLRG